MHHCAQRTATLFRLCILLFSQRAFYVPAGMRVSLCLDAASLASLQEVFVSELSLLSNLSNPGFVWTGIKTNDNLSFWFSTLTFQTILPPYIRTCLTTCTSQRLLSLTTVTVGLTSLILTCSFLLWKGVWVNSTWIMASVTLPPSDALLGQSQGLHHHVYMWPAGRASRQRATTSLFKSRNLTLKRIYQRRY